MLVPGETVNGFEGCRSFVAPRAAATAVPSRSALTSTRRIPDGRPPRPPRPPIPLQEAGFCGLGGGKNPPPLKPARSSQTFGKRRPTWLQPFLGVAWRAGKFEPGVWACRWPLVRILAGKGGQVNRYQRLDIGRYSYIFIAKWPIRPWNTAHALDNR